MTSDHKSVRIKSSDIESIQKAKDNDYQVSGVDPADQKNLSIKDTPFDSDQDK
jgi:hypothetical protein